MDYGCKRGGGEAGFDPEIAEGGGSGEELMRGWLNLR